MDILLLFYLNLVTPIYQKKQDTHIIKKIFINKKNNLFFGVFGEENKSLIFIEISDYKNNIAPKYHLIFKSKKTENFVLSHVDSVATINGIKIFSNTENVILVENVNFFEY